VIKKLLSLGDKKAKHFARLPYSHIELFQVSSTDGRVNFKDRLADIICRRMISARGFTLDDEVNKQERLLSVGSVLHFAKTGDHVWGSGWDGGISDAEFKAKSLKVHAVRGPLTAEFLRKQRIEVPDIYGDPVLLIPHVFPNRFAVTAEKKFVFVPSISDLPLVEGQANVVSPLWGWNRAITQIVSAQLVLASSLHGLMIAEAFGIPARYVRLSKADDLFKYKDYYLGSGRKESELIFANSIEKGLEMGGAQAIRFDRTALIKAFPFTLWK
jgi:pyruvyltransferase